MDKQPEALVLARALESGVVHRTMKEAAEELRRLHQVNQELVEALEVIKHSMDMAQVNSNDWRREVRLSKALAQEFIAKHKEQA